MAKRAAAVTPQHVAIYRRVHPQPTDLLTEMRELSKKKPDDAVNKFKLEFINDKLSDANWILGDTFRPLKSFTEFDVDAMPTNSDVVIIVSQYLGSLARWRNEHSYSQSIYRYWRTEPPIRVDSDEDDDED